MRAWLRGATVVPCALTAAYAWLAASSFTFHDFVRSDMFGISAISRWHVAIYWIWLAVAVFDLRKTTGRHWRSVLASPFAIVWAIVGVALSVDPLLPKLADDHRSLIVGVLALTPLLWLAAIDHWRARRVLLAPRPDTSADRDLEEGRLLVAAVASASVSGMIFAALVPILMRGQFEPDLMTAGLTLGVSWNVIGHLQIFCAAFLVLALVNRLAATRAPFPARYAIIAGMVAIPLAVTIDRSLCDTLGFDGFWGYLVAGAAASTIVATWSALRLRRAARRAVPPATPLDVFVAPAPEGVGRLRAVLPFGVVAVAAYGLAVATAVVDWDFMLLKAGVFVLWLAIFTQVYKATPGVHVSNGALAATCLLPLAAYLVDPAIQRRVPTWVGDPQFNPRRVLDRYQVYNPSFRLVDGLLRRPAEQELSFDDFLRANTAVSKLEVQPVNLDFVSPLGPAPRQPPPHVFLFVIDSLRPDYLAPYNPAVTFTPRIAEFAADSLVFRNAMTRYGATGLSLPAMWMGAVGVHKQYVRPFWPMNTLEKLLNANGYRRLMSVDVLMDGLLLPSPQTVELDRGSRTLDYDLCQTLDELKARFPAAGTDNAPVFAYTNPQNLHLSNLVTASVPPGETYPGFHAPVATRVGRLDGCFGGFIDFLKRRNLYDRSVIIVTSDHGELLGEEGRWGHAYYLFPPVLEIPLIMHLPAAARGDRPPDLGAVSFSTDIAPTVYAALGYQPRPANRLMGDALIGDAKVDPWRRRRGDYVVAASYSAVYGVVRKNGRRVYIVDAIKHEDYAYDRTLAGWKAVQVTRGLRANAQRIIREHIAEIRRVYRLAESS